MEEPIQPYMYMHFQEIYLNMFHSHILYIYTNCHLLAFVVEDCENISEFNVFILVIIVIYVLYCADKLYRLRK